MITATIEFDYWEGGWISTDAPETFTAGDSNVVAHDLLEHLPHNTGDDIDELLALGALLYVRGETWDRTRTYPLYVAIGNEIESLFLKLVEGAYSDEEGVESIKEKKIPRTTSIGRDDCVLEYACAHFLAELQRNPVKLDQTASEHYEKVAYAYMRKGYRAARKRYGKISRLCLGELFQQVSAAVSRIDTEDPAERTVKITISPTRARVYTRVLYGRR